MRNLLIFSILSVLSLNAFSAESMFIPHKEFVRLNQKNQDFYVKAIRESALAVMSEKEFSNAKQASFLKESWLLEILFPQAIAEIANDSNGVAPQATNELPESNKKDCIAAGYVHSADKDGYCGGPKKETIRTCAPERVGKENKVACPINIYGYDSDGNVICASSIQDCASVKQSRRKPLHKETRCISNGYVQTIGKGQLTNGIIPELCGGKPGFKSDEDVNLKCDPDKVGMENKYPCLPAQIYGYQSNGNVFCVSANPLKDVESRGKYFNQCAQGSNQIKTSAAKAAAIIEKNPENYEKLGQYLSSSCKRNVSPHEKQGCGRAIALLEDARVYVGTKKSDDSTPAIKNGNVR